MEVAKKVILDLNPTAKFWANMKRWIKDKITGFTELYDALKQLFHAQNLIFALYKVGAGLVGEGVIRANLSCECLAIIGKKV